MKKSKITAKKIRRYLREISVVVIGVAITLSALIEYEPTRTEKVMIDEKSF